MVPDFVPLYAVVIVLFSLIYFALASLSFLLVRLDLPDVSRLFRGLFNVYFWMVGVTGLVATGCLPRVAASPSPLRCSCSRRQQWLCGAECSS